MCFFKMLYLADQRFETRQTKSACDSRRSAGAADRAEHNLVLTSRLPAAVAIFDVIAGRDPADPVIAASQGKRADSYLRFLDKEARAARGWAWCTSCSPPRMPIRARWREHWPVT